MTAPPTAPPRPKRRPYRTAVTLELPVHWGHLAWSLVVLATLALAVLLAYQVRTVTVPLMMALAVAYALNPLVSFLERHRLGRTSAVCLVLGGLLIAGLSFGVLLAPHLLREAELVPAKLELLLVQSRPWLEGRLGLHLPDSFEALLTALQSSVDGGQRSDVSGIARSASSVARTVFGGTVSVVASLGSLLLVPFFTFFILRDQRALNRYVRELVPLACRGVLGACWAEIDATLSAFVRGQLTVSILLALIYGMGLTLAEVPLGFAIGLMTGLGNVVPYFGTTLGLTAATLVTLLSWQGMGHLLLVYGIFLACHALDGWVIAPRIIGNSVGLSVAAVILAILVFGELLGFFGVLVAVPLTAVLKILWRIGVASYHASGFYTGVEVPVAGGDEGRE